MFYLSRVERWAFVLLLALLLAGAGVFTYQRGRRAARAGPEQPLFVEATAAPAVEATPTASIPQSGSATQPTGDATQQDRLLSLNSATSEQLQALPGIGPVYAQRIIDYREQLQRDEGRGFRSVDELLNIPGIGPKRFSDLQDRVTP